MSLIEGKLSEQFYAWEERGRGWRVFDAPVSLEPPFRPFHGHFLPPSPPIDDGRRPTALSTLLDRFRQALAPEPAVEEAVTDSEEEEPEPEWLERGELVELSVSLPANSDPDRDLFAHVLQALSHCREPIAFELLGLSDRILSQFVSGEADAPLLRRQLQAGFPDAVFMPQQGTLENVWIAGDEGETAIVEFGLAKEFMFPLAGGKADPFVGLTAALSELQLDELGLFQVLFQSARQPWPESIVRAVTHADGKPFFVNAPELVDHAHDKVSRPLYAAVVRIAARAADIDRAWEIARELACALNVFAHPNGNELIPLRNDEYPFEAHVEDVLRRQSRRSGMLLNAEELIGFVHLPSADVRAPKLARELTKTKAAPAVVQGQGFFLGTNTHAGRTAEVRLSPDQRVRHCHIIGASGTGKSTLLFNLIRQDIENGEGIALLDPHGDLVERILGVIPPERIDDVVLVDPSDEGYSVGFNILSAHSDLEKNLLASDLVSVFQRLSTSWGDQMGSVFHGAIHAFLESSQGGTLADLRRFLIEPEFRNRFLQTVRDPDIVYYWRKGFVQLSGNKSIGPVLTRLETFLAPKPIRYMVAQGQNRLDFAGILDTGKIFLAKLPQGQMGKENAFLLGSLLVAKFQETAMSRQAQGVASRRPFYLYIDEFQNFITPSMAEILTGARKYRLGLILAHQELRQLERDREVASSVLANPYTRVVFRVGDDDARKLAEGFASFEARDLQNLGTGQAVCRVERSDFDFNLTIPPPKDSDPAMAAQIRARVIAASRAKYALPRAEIEAALLAKMNAEDAGPVKAKPASPSVPKATEVPKTTGSERESMVPEVKPVVVEPEPPAVPLVSEPPQTTQAREKPKAPRSSGDSGRGGAQHKAIQHRLKVEAEKLGFGATIEQEILNGQGSIDLFLERGADTIACEISFTTTIDHEVGNVLKCLKAGCRQVAVVCTEPARLAKIRAAVTHCVSAGEAASVHYFQPEELLAHLRALAVREPLPPPPPETKVMLGKYKVKTKHAPLDEAERARKEQQALQAMKEAMKQRTKP